MTVIACKTKKSAILILELIIGMLIMAAAVIAMPIGVFINNKELLTNLYVWGAVIIGMLFFGLIGFFGFVRPFFLFRKLPDIQAETDGTYLYIHSKKEAKIPLSEMDGTYLNAEIPNLLTKEFFVHLLSDRYGKVIIKVPKHGKYKLYFISDADSIPSKIASLIENS